MYYYLVTIYTGIGIPTSQCSVPSNQQVVGSNTKHHVEPFLADDDVPERAPGAPPVAPASPASSA